MRKINLIPPLVLILGVVGAFIRSRELATVFDGTTGLAESGAGISCVLVILTVAVAVGALALALVLSGSTKQSDSFKRAFVIKNYLSFALMTLLGVAVAVCAVLTAFLSEPPLDLGGISRWVFVAVMVFTGLGMVCMAYSAYTQRDNVLLPMGSVVPSVFYCYWMVALYRVNAGNPVLLDYCYSVLALAASAMSFYYCAGYAYGRRNLYGAVFATLVSEFLLLVAMADPAPMPLRVTMLFTATYQMILLVNMLSALKKVEKNEAEPEKKGDEA